MRLRSRRPKPRSRRASTRPCRKGSSSRAAADEILGRITTTLESRDLAEGDLVVEAVAEDLATQARDLPKSSTRPTKPDAILATTTSSLSVVDLAAVTRRPDRVIGLHFFNPAPVMKLVEVVRTVATAERGRAAMPWHGSRSIKKHPVRCRDRAGFIVNFLLFPYLNDAVRMHEEGYGTPRTSMRR